MGLLRRHWGYYIRLPTQTANTFDTCCTELKTFCVMVYEMKVPPYYKLQGNWVQTGETIDPDPRKGALGTEGQSPPNEKQRPKPRLIQDYINNWWEEGFRSEITALPKTLKGGAYSEPLS